MTKRHFLIPLVAGLLSSCGIMVDNSFTPPPIAAQSGDTYFDAGYTRNPELADGGDDQVDFRSAISLGGGVALTDFDFIYFNAQSSVPSSFGEDHSFNLSARYQRKVFLTGYIEHFVVAQTQFMTWGSGRDNQGASGYALGFQYIGRLNAPGAIQPYGGLLLGAGTDVSFDEMHSLGTLALGLQYRFHDNWEARVEFNQNLMSNNVAGYHQFGGGLNLHIRYIIP